ncbi:MAG TPA: biotin transporter BioY [Longimicrobiales bacterium]|nr:biotin transporter BioY [Longimicrobiales bacterium]
MYAARATPALLAGALATAVAAQLSLSVPGSPVPQSLQTLAVVVVGGVLGPGRGALALLLYAAMGAAGLPVFADGASGVARLWGPTGGYLAGFVAGAALAGWWVRRRRGTAFGYVAAGMASAHAVILAMGWLRLAVPVGAAAAWSQGVAPFLWGGAVKSLAAAAILVVWARRGRGGDTDVA